MAKNKLILLATIFLSSSLTSLTFLVSPPATTTASWLLFHISLAIYVLFSIIYTGSAILFLLSLQVYKPELRAAYRRIALSILLVGLGALQFPFVSIFDLWQTVWVAQGLIAAPFVLSAIIGYTGARAFVRLLNTRTILTNARLVVGVIVGVALVVALVPHGGPVLADEAGFHASRFLITIMTLLRIATALLILQASRRIGRQYAKATFYLFLALFVTASTEVIILIAALLTGLVVSSAPAILCMQLISSIIYIVASYTFSKAGMLLGGGISNVLELITSTAGFVSNPIAIDSLLDRVRLTTSHIAPGQEPSTQDTQELLDVYIGIEEYLINKDPIRAFRQEELRARLSPALRQQLEMLVDNRSDKTTKKET